MPPRGAADPTAEELERMAGNSVEGIITHLVTLRYHAGLTIRSRFVFESRAFAVRGWQNMDERDQWMRVSCEEVLA